MKKIILTLCLVVDGEKVLLGYKKRGFGEGLWNGFGGKPEDGESIKKAVLRELKEEADVSIRSLKKAGEINFTFDEQPNEILEVKVYRGEGLIGEPRETDEMLPKWFLISEIPYQMMWPDDVFWMPILLEGKEFKGAFNFDKDKKITKHKLLVVGENLKPVI